MSISVREVATGAASGVAASASIAAGAEATDLLLAIGWSDFYTLASGSGFGPPSGGGWTERVTADLGANNSKCRVWTRTAAGGAETITLAPIINEDVGLAILVLSGVDLGSPVDAVASGTSPGDTPPPSLHVVPSASPASDDAFLVCAAGTSVFNGGADYTPPSGMTEVTQFNAGGSTVTCTVATEQLAASGATGTRTFAYGGTADAGVAVAVALRTANGDGPLDSGPPPAVAAAAISAATVTGSPTAAAIVAAGTSISSVGRG